VRVTTGVDGGSTNTDGESSRLSASVLFDTLVVAIRRSDELPALPPPSEKIDRRFGKVSGDMAASFGDVSPSSKHGAINECSVSPEALSYRKLHFRSVSVHYNKISTMR